MDNCALHIIYNTASNCAFSGLTWPGVTIDYTNTTDPFSYNSVNVEGIHVHRHAGIMSE